MGKRTRGSGLPVLGVLFIAGGFYAATAAAQPVIQVGSGSGSAGGTATFSVTLSAGGAQVAATENDISFDGQAPVAVSAAGHCAITNTTTCTTTANCPVLPEPFTNEACLNEACVSGHCAVTTGQTCTAATDCPLRCAVTTAQTCSVTTDCPTVTEACIPEGGPDCTVNSAIGKQGFFSFLPNFCSNSPTTVCVSDSDCPSQVVGSCSVKCSGATCTSMRAIVFAVDNFNAISDGSALYSCNVAIASGATVGSTHPLTVANESAGDINQNLIRAGVTGTSGTITVGTTGQSFLVCNVEPHTGDDIGQFGNPSNTLGIADTKSIFKAAQFGGSFLPAAGSARLSAMDAAPVDNPPSCGGSSPASINIADVKLCFKRAQFAGQTNYTRTFSGSSCTSAVAP